MKKSIIYLLSIILLAGCSKGTKAPVTTTTPIASNIPVSEPTLKVLSPAGAPALSELGAIEKGYDVKIMTILYEFTIDKIHKFTLYF